MFNCHRYLVQSVWFPLRQAGAGLRQIGSLIKQCSWPSTLLQQHVKKSTQAYTNTHAKSITGNFIRESNTNLPKNDNAIIKHNIAPNFWKCFLKTIVDDLQLFSFQSERGKTSCYMCQRLAAHDGTSHEATQTNTHRFQRESLHYGEGGQEQLFSLFIQLPA